METKDLLDIKTPLLEKFREIAPGTFRHSQNVSLLCESIAVELNLDIDLLKTAGLYHDIGKMNTPDMFSENQTGDINVHDNLEPIISYQIITRHVGDSVVKVLQLDEFPDKIKLMNLISQHHGNSILRFFYNKAQTDIEDTFRYKTLSPQSIEAAILMICDNIEAQTRVEYKSDDFDKEKAVTMIIDRLVDDEQLDIIQIGDLRIIKKILVKELTNIYHKRIDYKMTEKLPKSNQENINTLHEDKNTE